MIFDLVEELPSYVTVLPQLQSVIDMLADASLDLTKGSHVTDIPGLRYNVAEYVTTQQDKEFEIHRKEVDVQVMVSGVERIATADRTLALTAGAYDEEGDCSLVQGPENGSVILEAGTFSIYLPGEPHKPGLAVDGQQEIQKVIFKIAVNQ